MVVENDSVLLLERLPVMMFPLRLDVSNDIRQLGLAHGEGTVSILPSESTSTKRVVKPQTRSAFNQLHSFADRERKSQHTSSTIEIGNSQPGCTTLIAPARESHRHLRNALAIDGTKTNTNQKLMLPVFTFQF